MWPAIASKPTADAIGSSKSQRSLNGAIWVGSHRGISQQLDRVRLAGAQLGGDVREAQFADFEIWPPALFSLPLALPGRHFAGALRACWLAPSGSSGWARCWIRPASRRRRERLGPAAWIWSGGLDEAGLPLADDDLVEQLLLLLFASYETTASSLSCLMAAVLRQQEVLPWWQSQRETIAWQPKPEQAANANDTALAALVQEVMRLNPPVGGFLRHTTKDLVLAGVLVPVGQVVQVAPAASNRYRDGAGAAPGNQGRDFEHNRCTASSQNHVAHGDGDKDGDPGSDDLERLRPERHLNGGSGLTLLPFGGGERDCLGKALAELVIRLMAVGLLRQL